MQKTDRMDVVKLKRILIICTGNTCRSPMAAYLLRDMLKKQGLDDRAEIDSAGLAAFSGDPISENALLALKELGIDASKHRAKPLSRYAVEQADLIYVMTESHRQAIISVIPEAEDKITVLGISDPYGMDITAYRSCLSEIERFFQAELPHIISGKDEKNDL